MNRWCSPVLVAALLCGLPTFAQTETERPAQSVALGNLIIRPAGFLEIGSISRSVASADDMSTRFGAIPLGDGETQEMLSVRHSRMQMKAIYPAGRRWKFSAYLESDFMNRSTSDPFRWRQYWGKVEIGKWEILSGRAWSLLRPNRAGINSENELMNTRVVDAGYHVGLAGNRDRLIRVVRHEKNWHFAASYENGKDFLGKVVHETRRTHLEAIGLSGAGRHRGVSGAAVIHATRNLDLVGQLYRARGGGRDALNTVPLGIKMVSALAGVEYRLTRRFQIFAYQGTVRGARSNGNRAVDEATIGFSREINVSPQYGRTAVSIQFSRTTRQTWPGASGHQTLGMVAIRHTMGTP